jgi:small subunit ribosomal protein S1
MSWTKKIKHPSKMLEIGQETECQVLEVDTSAKRISLGLKQLEPDPWELFTEKYKPGDKIEGKIRSITDYGVFVGIEDGVDGMVHKTDLSWTVRLNNPADLYAKGATLKAIILSINHDEKKVSLGVKQLWDDPWPTLLKEFPIGTVIDAGEVMAVCDYGAFVRLREGVEGLVPISDMASPDAVKVGEVFQIEVSSVDTMDRRLYLNGKNIGADKEGAAQRQKKALAAQAEAAPGTIGDLIKEKLGAKLGLQQPGEEGSADDLAEMAEMEEMMDEMEGSDE